MFSPIEMVCVQRKKLSVGGNTSGLVAGLSREPRAGNFCLKTATGGAFAAGARGRRGVPAAKTLPGGCSGLEVARPRVPGDLHYLVHPTSYPTCT